MTRWFVRNSTYIFDAADKSTRVQKSQFTWQSGYREDLTWSAGCSFPGEDLVRTATTDAEDCGRMCFETRNCTHFHWSGDGVCHLQTGVVSRHSAVKAGAKGAVCGLTG
jgi:hypothetical protein